MDSRKIAVSSLLACLLVSTEVVPSFADTPELSDIGNSFAQNEIRSLVKDGIVTGDENGTFRPADAMTREEFSAVLARSLKLAPDAAASVQFDDVDDWARGYVGALVKANLTQGIGDGQFGAHDPVSREQLAIFFVRALGYEGLAKELNLPPSFSDNWAVDSYAKPYVALSQRIGFIKGVDNGNGTFQFLPKENAQRQAVARLAYEFYTNGSTYKTKMDTMTQVDDILTKTAAAMKSADSYQVAMSVYLSGSSQSSGQESMTVDYVKNPLAMHITGTMSGVGNNGQPFSTPIEAYIQNGYMYDLLGGKWQKEPYNATSISSMVGLPDQIDDQTKVHFLAPALNVDLEGDSYILTGSLSPGESSALLPKLKWKGTQIRFVIDKNSYRYRSVAVDVYTTTEPSVSVNLTYQNYDNEGPIEIPQEALNPASAN